MNIDLNKYTEFVNQVTSNESNYLKTMAGRLYDIEATTAQNGIPVNISLLLTAGMGLSSEGGEFNEIVKKLVFQGKQYNEDIKFHLMRELGDIIFYWINACRSLGLDPNKVIEENVNKLQSRYPDGKFNAFQSENRKQGDL
jgi:NTP pyrophosphatase (non-canonical NTP hydrolase)